MSKVSVKSIAKYYSMCLCVFFIALSSCNKYKKAVISRDNLYDYEVLYLYQGDKKDDNDKYRFKLASDSLYILVEGEFIKSLITINADNRLVFNDTVNTSSITGLAKVFVLGDIKRLDYLSIRVDSGPLILVEMLDVKNNIIGIRKEDKKIQVVLYKKMPAFD